MSSTNLPSHFGPSRGIDSKDYMFYMQAPGAAIPTAPVKLIGHSVTSPNQNLIDPVMYTTVEDVGGEVRVVSRVKRAAQETSRSYTIGLPSAIWTPVMEQAMNNRCPTTFYMIYQCPPDAMYAHWYILPEAFLNPPIEAEDLVTTGDETNIITATTDLNTPQRLIGYGLGYSVIYDSGVAYNDVVFKTEDCRGCDMGYAQKLVAVGGDGTAIPLLTATANRFSTVTALTSGGAAGTVALATFRRGDYILTSLLVNGTPDTGQLRVSFDGGTTWAAIAGFTEIVYDILDVNGTLVLVGGDSTGGAVALISDYSANLTTVTSTAIPAASALRQSAYDKATGRLYIVGDSGTLLVGRFNGSTLSLVDISANLVGSPGNLLAVCVRGDKNVVVGGASGYLAESHDSALTFASVGIGTSSSISSIAGNFYRMVVGAATKLFEQTALTRYEVREVVLQNGATLTGNITRVRMNVDEDFNRFVAVTDQGEVVMGVPFYPNA